MYFCYWQSNVSWFLQFLTYNNAHNFCYLCKNQILQNVSLTSKRTKNCVRVYCHYKRANALRNGNDDRSKHDVQSDQITLFNKYTISEVVVGRKRILCVPSGRSVFSEFFLDRRHTSNGQTVWRHVESIQTYYRTFFFC